MIFKWHAKADSTSAMIMWLVTVTAAIILGYWILKTTRPVHIDIKNLDNELEVLQQSLSTACDMEYYRWKYNPKLVRGNIMIRNDKVCIDNQQCRSFYYPVGSPPEVEDDRIIANQSSFCDDPMKCDVMYYFSDEEIQVTNTSITIDNVYPCEPSGPIIRCMPLVCDTGSYFDISLKDVVYIEITHKNGIFTATRQLLP